jgi:hypothetical protein
MGRSSWWSLVAVVAIGTLTTACSSSGSVDASALPRADAPVIGRALDARLADPDPALAPFDDGNGHGTVTPTGYQLGVKQAGSLVTAPLPGDFFADQVVTAAFSTDGSPADTGFGVVCRMQDSDNYYRLGVGNDGTYAIARVKGGDSTVLTGDGKWTTDPALRASAGPFEMRAECIGDTLTLFESNRQIASVKDATFPQAGKVGVFVETFHQPDATVQVRSLTVRAFRDRSRLSGAATDGWNDLLRTTAAATPCTLLETKRARVSASTLFVTKCGSVMYLQTDPTDRGPKVFDQILTKSGADLKPVKGLPNCAKRTGIQGPLPPPTPAGYTDTRPSIGRVACLDLEDSTAVVWQHDLAGVIGVTRVKDGDRAAWKGYGPDWPPFHFIEAPG